jgi:hypothetical protein
MRPAISASWSPSKVRELSTDLCKNCLGEVGTAVVCEEGDDVFAYASIVPLTTILVRSSPSLLPHLFQEGSAPFAQLFEELYSTVSQLGPGEGQAELLSCLAGPNRDRTGPYPLPLLLSALSDPLCLQESTSMDDTQTCQLNLSLLCTQT